MRDIDFHGTSLREGEKMLLLFEAANFDESVFGDPENFRIDRNPNSHMAFGFGTHFCLGNQLARLELNTMLRKLLRAAAGSAAGRRFGAAAAAGELRQRPGGDAGGVHPDQAGAGLGLMRGLSPSVRSLRKSGRFLAVRFTFGARRQLPRGGGCRLRCPQTVTRM